MEGFNTSLYSPEIISIRAGIRFKPQPFGLDYEFHQFLSQENKELGKYYQGVFS